MCVVLAAPFFLFRDLPLFDLPNHVARQHILFDPALSAAHQFYVPRWRLVPNLAIDAVVYLLHWAVPIDLAVRIFLAATAIQLFLGVVFLHRTLFGPSRGLELLGALLVFNGPFLLGLVNLAFGYGLSLWAFALWLRLGSSRSGFLVSAALSTLALVAHLFAFAVYAVVVLSYGLRRGPLPPWGEGARWLWRRAHLAVPTIVYLTLMPADLHDNYIHASTLRNKLWALTTVDGIYNPRFDVACLLLVFYGAFVLRSRLRVAAEMLAPLAVLAIGFVLLPFQIGQGTWVDYRMPCAFFLFLAASTGWRQAPAWRARVEAALLGLFALRTAIMLVQWGSWQPIYAEYHEAFARLPWVIRLLPIGTHPNTLVATEHPPLSHVDALAVTERGVFIPTMFAGLPHELLDYTPEGRRLQQAFEAGPDPRGFDYVLRVNEPATPVDARFTEVYRGSGFVLERIEK